MSTKKVVAPAPAAAADADASVPVAGYVKVAGEYTHVLRAKDLKPHLKVREDIEIAVKEYRRTEGPGEDAAFLENDQAVYYSSIVTARLNGFLRPVSSSETEDDAKDSKAKEKSAKALAALKAGDDDMRGCANGEFGSYSMYAHKFRAGRGEYYFVSANESASLSAQWTKTSRLTSPATKALCMTLINRQHILVHGSPHPDVESGKCGGTALPTGQVLMEKKTKAKAANGKGTDDEDDADADDEDSPKAAKPAKPAAKAGGKKKQAPEVDGDATPPPAKKKAKPSPAAAAETDDADAEEEAEAKAKAKSKAKPVRATEKKQPKAEAEADGGEDDGKATAAAVPVKSKVTAKTKGVAAAAANGKHADEKKPKATKK